MIVSKPKVSTLFSLFIFLFIAFGLFAYGLFSIRDAQEKLWWMILIYTSGPIGMVVMIKTLAGIKIISISKGKFEIRYPFRIRNIHFEAKDIEIWQHEKIKTYGGQYEEIIWKLKSGKQHSISKQENTEYDKTLKYMKSKFDKMKVKKKITGK